MTDTPKISIWTLPCLEASRLTSESVDRTLSRHERLALRIHTFICGRCRRFAAQSAAIHELIGMMPEHLRLKLDTQSLSPRRRDLIEKLLADEMRKDALQ